MIDPDKFTKVEYNFTKDEENNVVTRNIEDLNRISSQTGNCYVYTRSSSYDIWPYNFALFVSEY